MRLSMDQVTTIQQNTSLKVVPHDHQSIPDLEKAFGVHTFFINDNGLLVFERADNGDDNDMVVRLFVVAVWEDEKSTGLLSQTPPAATEVLVNLTTGDVSTGS